MYWYNPKNRASERVAAPSNDEQAVRMLAGYPESARFVSEYAELRRSGAPIERALVSVGHEERLRQHEHAPVRLAWRERPRRSRPSARGYEILVAVRLREEDRDRRRARRSPGGGLMRNPAFDGTVATRGRRSGYDTISVRSAQAAGDDASRESF